MSVVQTVLGPISPNLLGRTLTHEHLALDFETFYCDPPIDFKEVLAKRISLDTLGYVRQYPYSSMENLKFNDSWAREAVLQDMQLYRKYGGGSIVENSSHGLKRDLELMVTVQKTTGVHVIAGTGHYVHNVQSAVDEKLTVEQMTDMYSKEIISGIAVPNVGQVKCGFIGEVGSVYPINDFEKRAIRATGEIQEVLGCGVSFHPGRDPEAPFEIVRMYLEAGGKADKCVMSHLDRTIFDMEKLFEFAALGTYMQYDLFGTECSYYQLNPTMDMPSDAQRINNLMLLIEDGWVDKLLLSHDIHTKHRLTSYGGHGYHHVYMNILPRLFGKGLTIQQVEQMTVVNPANWLQFKI